MRGEIGRPKRTREKKPAGERRRGKRYRQEEAGRKRRSFSYSRLFENLQSPPIAQQRGLLLSKAHDLAFPAHATGKYKQVFIRKQYGRDVSAGGSSGLPAFHKGALHLLLNDLLLRHHWPQLAGVLCVLLRALLAERDWNPEYKQYFWAVMEVTRQLDGVEANDFKFRRIFQILHDKQPRGPWSWSKEESGAVRLELALYLMNGKHYEDANLASEPFMDIPPYRDHPLANLVHGLIHYHQWFELVKQEVQRESGRRASGHLKEDVDLSEGVGENDGVFSDGHFNKASLSNEERTFRLDDDLISEDTSNYDFGIRVGSEIRSSNMFYKKEALPPVVKEETPWNFHDDAEEDGEKSYLKRARVVYSAELDKMLFPFTLPYQYMGKGYLISMGIPTLKASYSTAVKHLRETLLLERQSTAALLPLVQLMLAGADVEGAYTEIEKCCQKFSDCNSYRIKCTFLESLSPRNNEMLINAYEELLEKDPSSMQQLQRLIDMHRSGIYTTDALLLQLGFHLDACQGATFIWRKLASCFQNLKKNESEVGKNSLEVKGDADAGFLQEDSIREAWKLRKRWWLVKHFQVERMEEDLIVNGIQWLVFKAASAAHIYGPSVAYVSEVEKHIRMLGSYPFLEKLLRHKENSFGLLSHLRLSNDV